MISRMSLMWFDPPTAWRTVFILSTSTLFWHKAGTGQIDMLLLGLEMSALYLLLTHDKTPQALAREAKAWLEPSQPLLLFGMNGEIFAFYSDRPGRSIDTAAALDVRMARQGKGIVVFSDRNRELFEDRYKDSGKIRMFRMGGKELGFLKYDVTFLK